MQAVHYGHISSKLQLMVLHFVQKFILVHQLHWPQQHAARGGNVKGDENGLWAIISSDHFLHKHVENSSVFKTLNHSQTCRFLHKNCMFNNIWPPLPTWTYCLKTIKSLKVQWTNGIFQCLPHDRGIHYSQGLQQIWIPFQHCNTLVTQAIWVPIESVGIKLNRDRPVTHSGFQRPLN